MKDTKGYFLNHHILLVDFTVLEIIRQNYIKKGLKKPSYVPLTMFAMSWGLKKFPVFNSYLRTFPWPGHAIYKNIDLVYTAEKMINPEQKEKKQLTLSIIRDCETMELNDFLNAFEKQKKATLSGLNYAKILKFFLLIPNFIRFLLFRLFCKPIPEIMRKIGGTAAFTSVGKYGVDFTTPLSPKSMTVSLGSVKMRPLVTDKGVEPRLTAYLTFTYDHRIADGRECAQFAAYIKNIIETGEIDAQYSKDTLNRSFR